PRQDNSQHGHLAHLINDGGCRQLRWVLEQLGIQLLQVDAVSVERVYVVRKRQPKKLELRPAEKNAGKIRAIHAIAEKRATVDPRAELRAEYKHRGAPAAANQRFGFFTSADPFDANSSGLIQIAKNYERPFGYRFGGQLNR